MKKDSKQYETNYKHERNMMTRGNYLIRGNTPCAQQQKEKKKTEIQEIDLKLKKISGSKVSRFGFEQCITL